MNLVEALDRIIALPLGAFVAARAIVVLEAGGACGLIDGDGRASGKATGFVSDCIYSWGVASIVWSNISSATNYFSLGFSSCN